jgi:hypothetical protein
LASTSATEVICTTPTLAGEAPVVALAPAAAAAEAMARPTRKRKRNRNLTAAEAAAVAAVGSEAAREARAMRQRPRLRLGRRHVRGYTRPGARTGGGGVHTWTFPAVGSDQRGILCSPPLDVRRPHAMRCLGGPTCQVEESPAPVSSPGAVARPLVRPRRLWTAECSGEEWKLEGTKFSAEICFHIC